MNGAHSLAGALASISPFFLPACIQLDFQPERKVSGALDKNEMAASDGSGGPETATPISRRRGAGWVTALLSRS
jgi:hypothetical protein